MITVKAQIKKAIGSEFSPTKCCRILSETPDVVEAIVKGSNLAELAARNANKHGGNIGAAVIGELLARKDAKSAASAVFYRLTNSQKEKYERGGESFASLFISALFTYPREKVDASKDALLLSTDNTKA